MTLPPQTQFVGILNITPDSFSDGGKYLDIAAALSHARTLIDEGAAVIDVGAESTRPGATPLSEAQEWERLSIMLPELVTLTKTHGVALSLDTYHPETAHKAIALGVDWINDVSGFTHPAMIDAVRSSDVRLVVMHNLGVPADKTRTLPEGCDPVEEVYTWAETRLAELEAAGIARERIIFDPGLGFGKTAEQSMALVKGISAFHRLGVPLFVGHSRKSFLSLLAPLTREEATSQKLSDREEATLKISYELAKAGVHYLRVHAVGQNLKAIAGLHVT